MNEDKKYRILFSELTSPAFNLACEEYFLTDKNDEFLLLWRNSPSVIIGRNQNAHSEINLQYVKDNNIAVIRRLTGGGAVYHDLGNINFSYIFNNDSFVDLKSQLTQVIAFLKSIGLDAQFSGRNDILADGYKVSGTAQVTKKGRSIVHGTLLYSADLTVLTKALKPNPLKLESKGISSVRSRVSNISDLLKSENNADSFFNNLYSYMLRNESCEEYIFSENDIKQITALKENKYDTWDWNFGDAPKFTMEKSVLSKCGLLTANYTVKNGLIEDIKFFGDFNSLKDTSCLEKLFIGLSSNPELLKKQIQNIDFESFIQNANRDDFLKLFE